MLSACRYTEHQQQKNMKKYEKTVTPKKFLPKAEPATLSECEPLTPGASTPMDGHACPRESSFTAKLKSQCPINTELASYKALH